MDASVQFVSELTASLPHADVVSLRTASLDETGLRLLGAKPSLLLVRPDSYVDLVGAAERSGEWRAYAARAALVKCREGAYAPMGGAVASPPLK